MTDDQSFDHEDNVDDPLARIRARFEQASERILSGTDDPDSPPAEPAAPIDPPVPVATLRDGDVDYDDFGEIDIQDDARFSLDFEHGVSDVAYPSAVASVGHLLGADVDLVANLDLVRADAPERALPQIDPDRHTKHRTRGRIDLTVPEVVEPEADEPEVVEPAKSKRRKEKTEREVTAEAAKPQAAAAGKRPSVEDQPRSRRGLAVTAGILVAAGAVAGYFLLASPGTDATPDTTAATTTSTTRLPATPTEAAAVALDAFGFTDLQVGVDETGVATIVGMVRTARERDIAIDIVAEIDGVVEVLTDITYDINRDPSAIRADIEELALTVSHPLTFSYGAGIVDVTGIVPPSAIQSGELGAGGTLERKLTDISGVEEVRWDLTERGNAFRLATKLTELLTTSPVVYDVETGERPTESDAVFEQIAALMEAEPGLQIRVAVRGDDAEDDEGILLAEQRRDEVVTLLVDAGVDPELIVTVLVETMDPAVQDLPSDVLVEVVAP